MAHLVGGNYPNISQKLSREQSHGLAYEYGVVIRRWKHSRNIQSEKIRWRLNRNVERERERGGAVTAAVVKCCSSTSTSTSSTEDGIVIEKISRIEKGKEQFEVEYLVNEYGWQVRRLAETDDEIRKAVNVQALAFHEPVAFFTDFFFQFFQAEVLSGLLYKLKNSPPSRYACLVAEAANATEDGNKEHKLVGVVDVTVLRDQNVVRLLPNGIHEYLYISGIAVSDSFRRQKVATVLLNACDVLSLEWGFEVLVLRAYEDDTGARNLYTKAGYRVISSDPPWFTTWIGRKRRLLMIKHSNVFN